MSAAEMAVLDSCCAAFGRPALGLHDPIDLARLPRPAFDALTERLSAEFGVDLGARLPSGPVTVSELADRIEWLVTSEVDALFGAGDGADEHIDVDGWRAGCSGAATVLATVHDLVEAWAARTPSATALVFQDSRVSYAELEATAGRMAQRLRAGGVRRGDVVAVHVPRGTGLVAWLLAIMKVGAVFTVLDLDHPVDQRNQVLAAARAVAIVVTESEAECLDHSGLQVFHAEAPSGGAEADDSLDPESGKETATPVGPLDAVCVIFTSGTSGAPKGVLAPHQSITATLTGQDYGSFTPGDVWLQCSPVSWDAILLELFGPLVSGGLCVLQPGQRPEPRLIADLVVRHGVTNLFVSASLLNFLIDEYPETFAAASLHHVMTGGEAPSIAHLARLREIAPRLRVDHAYAPVECMIFTLTHRLVPEDLHGSVPVGRALNAERAYVLDRNLDPVPLGVQGEVYLAGAGLAHGYVGLPGQTAGRFVACPYGAGERMYRTGDLGAWDNNGDLVLRGRADDQIKIRGHRVEPAGISAALQALPGVRRAATIVREDRPGDRRLTSYAVADSEVRLDSMELRAALRHTLPDFAVPSAIVVLAELPVTPTGKLDRAALPAPESVRPRGGPAARTPREEILCGLFAEVLGVPEVGLDDGFFDLGGHSLLATKLVSRIRRALNAGISLREVFEHPTVSGVARCLDGAGREAAQLTSRKRPASVPLSPAQEGLWFIERFNDATATYNVPAVLRLSGTLDAQALEEAFRDVVERHEALRTVFEEVDGRPRQVVLPDGRDRVTFERREVAPARLDAELGQTARHVFDLSAEIPIRAFLLAVGSTDHALVLVMHHIVADGLSMRPLLADLADAYAARLRGGVPAWPPLAIQYADYSLWQYESLGDAADPRSLISTQLAFWREALAALPEEVPLPADGPRLLEPAAYGLDAEAQVEAALHQRLTELARAESVTMFMVVQSAVSIVLHLNGAGTDIPLGTPVAGRTDEALNPLVGFFVNTLVLRSDLSGDPTLAELLSRARTTALAAYAHQDVPFHRIVDDLNPARSATRNPLFQTMVTLEPEAAGTSELPGLRAELSFADADTGPKFDLEFGFTERRGPDGEPAGLAIQVAVNSLFFDPSTGPRLAHAARSVLEQFANRPGTRLSALPATTPAEFEQVIRHWNDTGTAIPALVGAHEIFEAQADRTPQATALVFRDRALTYRELDEAASRMARHLWARGARRGDVIGICVEREPELVIGLLAALKVGGAYLLCDPTHPADRRLAMLDAADVAVVITSGASDDPPWSEGLLGRGVRTVHLDNPAESAAISRARAQRLGRPVHAEDPAAVMFTSGSTGRPKGVVAPHRALVATHTATSYLDHRLHHVYLQCSPVSWDAFALELFSALFHGGTCVLQPGQSPDLVLLEEQVERHGVTALQLSASLFNALVDEGAAALARVPHFMIGGEAASPAHIARAYARHPAIRITNGYGPVESMGFTTCHDVAVAEAAAASVPIGRPIDNKRAYVLDQCLRPVPPGVAGELYVAGLGLAHGYVGQSALTAERFVADPFRAPSGRMYRTGDAARWTKDGTLEFLGRADDQIKFHGYRIEPGEIEAALQRVPGVGRAAVAVREEQSGDKRLVGYLSPAGGSSPSGEELRAALRRILPDYLVPSVFVVLDELPLNANGKLDRRALPAPGATAGPRLALTAPRSALEHAVAEVWAQVLGVADVGVYDNFFALGGDSISSMRVVSRLRKLGLVVTARTLFDHQTVADLTAAAQTGPSLEAEQGAISGPVALTPVQHWFFAQEQPVPQHFNQSTVLAVGAIEPEPLARAMDALLVHHDALRTRFVRDPERTGSAAWRQEVPPAVPAFAVTCEKLDDLPPDVREMRWQELAERAQASFDLASPPLVRAVFADLGPGEGRRLLISIHHLVVDIVSWPILLEDLETAYRQVAAGGKVRLPAKTTSFQAWSRRLQQYAAAPADPASFDLWSCFADAAGIGTLHPTATPDIGAPDTTPGPGDQIVGWCDLRLDAAVGEVLVSRAPAALGVTLEDLVLAALALALCSQSGEERVLIDVEGHGREPLFDDVDLSRTVGWFTSLHPLELAVARGADAVSVVHATAALRESVPYKGIGYGILAYLADPETRRGITAGQADVQFNFHGVRRSTPQARFVELPDAPAGLTSHADNRLSHAICVDAEFVENEFHAHIAFRHIPGRRGIGSEIARHFERALRGLAEQVSGGDFVKRVALASLDRGEIAGIVERFSRKRYRSR
ncbi:MAG: amino acid adenylation domain-containing protein [Streptosporangiaceae bacterium]